MTDRAPPILVTGANGLVGRRVVEALLARGHRVRTHGRSAAARTREGVEHRTGDLLDTGSLGDLVHGVSAVCHLAAFIPPNHADSSFAEECYRVNALATLRLAEAALGAGVPRFVFTSSASGYPGSEGSALGNKSVTEETVPYPAARACYYLTSKLAAELYLDHLARTRGLSLVTLRVSSVYGPEMASGAVLRRFLSLAAEGSALTVQGGGIPASDFVFVDDVASLVAAAVESETTGTFNAGSGEHTSLLALAHAVKATYPDREVTVNVEPPRGAPAPSFAALDIEKARRELAYSPVTLTEGLARMRRALEPA
ncbi:MAG: NAD(P)-dependent oxidoreductase [Polyangiaceae bacterium]